MLVKLLGLLDLLSATAIILSIPAITNPWVLIIASIYLIVKGIIFIKDIVSVLDLVLGIVAFLSAFITMHPAIPAFIGIFLAQKAIFSIFSN